MLVECDPARDGLNDWRGILGAQDPDPADRPPMVPGSVRRPLEVRPWNKGLTILRKPSPSAHTIPPETLFSL